MGTTTDSLRALVGEIDPTVIEEAITGHFGDGLEQAQCALRSALRQELLLMEIRAAIAGLAASQAELALTIKADAKPARRRTTKATPKAEG